MKANDVENKTAEIDWCWQMFDEILSAIQSDKYSPAEKLKTVSYFAVLGLKGRQDFREE